jgi:hypothetical protein
MLTDEDIDRFIAEIPVDELISHQLGAETLKAGIRFKEELIKRQLFAEHLKNISSTLSAQAAIILRLKSAADAPGTKIFNLNGTVDRVIIVARAKTVTPAYLEYLKSIKMTEAQAEDHFIKRVIILSYIQVEEGTRKDFWTEFYAEMAKSPRDEFYVIKKTEPTAE